jgi:hypothetical protein
LIAALFTLIVHGNAHETVADMNNVHPISPGDLKACVSSCFNLTSCGMCAVSNKSPSFLGLQQTAFTWNLQPLLWISQELPPKKMHPQAIWRACADFGFGS